MSYLKYRGQNKRTDGKSTTMSPKDGDDDASLKNREPLMDRENNCKLILRSI